MTRVSQSSSNPAATMHNLDKPWLLPHPRKYRFVNVNVVDPVEGQTLKNATVEFAGGRILSVTRSEDATAPAEPAATDSTTSEDVETIDLQGLYMSPGLIDAHVHVTATPGEQGLKNTYKAISASMNNYRTTFVVREMLARGFTTVRDCGGADNALKQAIEEWLIVGPRLNIAGHALSQTGGHGDQRDAHQDDDPTTKCCAGHKSGISRLCDGTTDCIVAVRDEIRKGANFVKIMAGGGVSSKLNNLAHAQFLPEELSAIVRTAASFDTYVTAHAYSNRAMRHAVEHGVLGIEHGNFLDQETAEYMASKHVYFTPTLATYHTLVKPPFDRWITEDLMVKNLRVMESGVRSLEIAEKAGLTICFGSDLMASMQPFQNNEFTIRSQVQSNLSILRSATINPAKMMRMEKDVGRVAAGLFADAVILKADPLVDIKVLDDASNILAVIKEGRVTTSQLSQLPVDIPV
ncbi:amidohydrolase-like protein [Xylariales sp. PMI_506]|nr:amidohydrolase-like protein [Xylariales sp. PMI_506]